MAISYSFIHPKPKHIFKKYTKVWVFYIILAVLCIIGFSKALEKQSISRISQQVHIEEEIESLKLKSVVIRDYIERLDYEISVAEHTRAQNTMLKDSLTNLIKLIPEQITTKSIELNYDTLALKGLTPSKEVYKFLLEAPLRAVFSQTRVEFYPLVSGWFNFVSVSKSNPALNPAKAPTRNADNE